MNQSKMNQANPMRFWHETQPTGAQAGPAEESTSAFAERILQELAGWGVGTAGGAAGYSVGGPAGAGVGVVPGLATIDNANTPNIQDVWAHKLMQVIRRRMNESPE
ncbi:MAG: hypothetical protein AB7U76_25050 [Pirellulales bacterium]